MHTDEAVNAYIVGQILAGQPFTYDPHDRHGPALAALALPLVKMQGAGSFSDLTESELRVAPVLAGTVTVLLFGAAVDLFGFMPCIIAALLFAMAPLPTYYDRYFIHESLFVAATFGLILSLWRAIARDSIILAMVAGACAGLMLACKETAALHFVALAVAALVFRHWKLRGKGSAVLLRPASALAAVLTFLLIAVLLFTWFGRNFGALSALTRAVPDMLARAGGQGHEKPIWYFARLLAGGWSGGFLLGLGCLGFILTVRRRETSPFGFLAIYAFVLAAVYSLIPYKTPWLALNLWLPLALFAGRAVESIGRAAIQRLPLRAAVPAFCVLGTFAAASIARDTRHRVFLDPVGETNPYAYAHTSDDLPGLPAEIDTLARQEGIQSPRIAVIASDPWPLPWYLRRYSQVGFWQPGQLVGDADFYVTSTEAAEPYKDTLKNYRPEFFGARPGVLILLWSPAPK